MKNIPSWVKVMLGIVAVVAMYGVIIYFDKQPDDTSGRDKYSNISNDDDMDIIRVAMELSKYSESGYGELPRLSNSMLASARKYAENGNVEFQNILGSLYFLGRGVNQDSREAIKWHKLAAAQGNATSMFMLSLLFMDVSYSGIDYDELVDELLLNAEEGNIEAQSGLGLLYYNGDEENGVAPDYEDALKWLKKSVSIEDKEYPKVHDVIGDIYFEGLGVEIDYPEAVKWYTLIAEAGNAEYQALLGGLYATGEEYCKDGIPIKKDYKKSLYWYAKAAAQGNAIAQMALGIWYRDGMGVDVDSDKAEELLLKSSRQGYYGGQLNLGVMYEFGIGIPINIEKAIKWYKLAAAQGEPISQSRLEILLPETEN